MLNRAPISLRPGIQCTGTAMHFTRLIGAGVADRLADFIETGTKTGGARPKEG